MNYSKTFLMGNLTAQPELKKIDSDLKVSEFSIAVNRKSKGEQLTSFFNCVAWGKTAEALASFTNKGQNLFLECEPRQETWTNNEGQKRSKVIFSVLNFSFTQPKGSNNYGGDDIPPAQEPTHGYQAPKQDYQALGSANPEMQQPEPKKDEFGHDITDNIPF